MEVDTGVTVSVMAEINFKKLFPDKILRKSIIQLKTRLKTYTSEALNVLGEVTVSVISTTGTTRVVVEGAGQS